GPGVVLGMARFAYGLLLPGMRADLHWSFAQAGAINTANAFGYLAGAMVTPAVSARIGRRAAFVGGTVAVVVTLLATAPAPGFAVPPILGLAGPSAGWRLGWLALALLSVAALAVAGWAARQVDAPAVARRGQSAGWPARRFVPSLASYLLFGLGYISYITFVVALLVREALPAAQWGPAIAALTAAFALGQCAGPVLTGLLSDLAGGVRSGLGLSAGLIGLAALIALAQHGPDPARAPG